MVDFGKVFDAGKWIFAGCLVFNLLLLGVEVALRVFGFGATVVAGAEVGIIASIVNMFLGWGLLAISVLGTFAIILYGGFFAAKKEAGLMGCGLVGLLAYGISDPIISVLRIVANTVLGLGAAVTSGDAAMGIFGSTFGAAWGIGMLFCGVGWFLGGLVANFLVGIIGGFIGGAK